MRYRENFTNKFVVLLTNLLYFTDKSHTKEHKLANEKTIPMISIDPTTGIVTSSTEKQGWVKVTVTYTGGEEHGGKSGDPQLREKMQVGVGGETSRGVIQS